MNTEFNLEVLAAQLEVTAKECDAKAHHAAKHKHSILDAKRHPTRDSRYPDMTAEAARIAAVKALWGTGDEGKLAGQESASEVAEIAAAAAKKVIEEWCSSESPETLLPPEMSSVERKERKAAAEKLAAPLAKKFEAETAKELKKRKVISAETAGKLSGSEPVLASMEIFSHLIQVATLKLAEMAYIDGRTHFGTLQGWGLKSWNEAAGEESSGNLNSDKFGEAYWKWVNSHYMPFAQERADIPVRDFKKEAETFAANFHAS